MKLSNKTLAVVVNPFAAALDSAGRACALVQCDPTSPSAARYIGARLSMGPVVQRPGNPFGAKAKQIVAYSLRPVNVADTPYYRAKLASGELFEAEGALPLIVDAARVAMNGAPEAVRALSLAAWDAQGLGAIADALGYERPKDKDTAPSEGVSAPVDGASDTTVTEGATP